MTQSEMESLVMSMRDELKRLSQIATNIPLRLAPGTSGASFAWFDATLGGDLTKGTPTEWTSAPATLFVRDGQNTAYVTSKDVTVYDVGFIQEDNRIPSGSLVRVLKKGKDYFYDGHNCDDAEPIDDDAPGG